MNSKPIITGALVPDLRSMKKFSLYLYHILILLALLFAFSKEDNSENKNPDSHNSQVENTLNNKPAREKGVKVSLSESESEPGKDEN
ncbi:MAG: hypothetical protein WBV11_04315 [Salegentibacter sp.]